LTGARNHGLVLPLAALILTVIAGAGQARAQDPGPAPESAAELEGYWSLNAALSDDPDDQLRNVRGAMPPPGRTPPDAGSAPPGAPSLEAVRRAVQGFSLALADAAVVIGYPGRELTLPTDGAKQKIQLADGEEAEYRAWWQEARLLVERKLDRGLTATEEYWVQDGTGRLHVLTRLTGDGLPNTIAFVRVYDSAEPPAGD
jgi:hypothetical protein